VKTLTHSVTAVVVSATIVILSGCTLDSTDDSAGTVTVQITNASSLTSPDSLGAFVLPAGTEEPFVLEDIIALGQIAFDGSESIDLVLETPDPAFNPSGQQWVAEPGWDNYALFVVVEPGGGNNQFDAAGESANSYPSRLVVSGDSVVSYDYIADLQSF
jgi:hypothetical protein